MPTPNIKMVFTTLHSVILTLASEDAFVAVRLVTPSSSESTVRLVLLDKRSTRNREEREYLVGSSGRSGSVFASRSRVNRRWRSNVTDFMIMVKGYEVESRRYESLPQVRLGYL